MNTPDMTRQQFRKAVMDRGWEVTDYGILLTEASVSYVMKQVDNNWIIDYSATFVKASKHPYADIEKNASSTV